MLINVEQLRRFQMETDVSGFYSYLLNYMRGVDYDTLQLAEPDDLDSLLSVITQISTSLGIEVLENVVIEDESSGHKMTFKRLTRSSMIKRTVLYNEEVYIDCLDDIKYVTDLQVSDITIWLVDPCCIYDKCIPFDKPSKRARVLVFEDVIWENDFKTGIPVEIRGHVVFKCNIDFDDYYKTRAFVMFSESLNNYVAFTKGHGISIGTIDCIQLVGVIVDCTKRLCLNGKDSEVIESIKGGRCNYVVVAGI